MKIVFENLKSNPIETYEVNSYFDLKKIISKKAVSSEPLRAYLFSYQINLNCMELEKINSLLRARNINLITIYTNSRETNVSAKVLKINSCFELDNNNSLHTNFLLKPVNNDLSHQGTIRSGDKISSNGNLFIIGDVNPGAQISAKKNIYVWGKLCGVAFAGKNGEDNCTISSLFLNPLQLRINNTVAIGPKEKPNNYHPEIALLEGGEIVIKPLIIS